MPHALVLHLTSNDPRPPRYPGVYAHGLFFALLSKIDPALASAVHAAKRKLFTVGVLQPTLPAGRVGKAGGVVALRITTLDDRLFAPMLEILLMQGLEGLTLGDQSYLLPRVSATPQGNPFAGSQTWEELLATSPTRRMRLRFHTPTVFATSKPGGRTRHTPLPEALLIAKSLLSSWQAHSPLGFSDKEVALLLRYFELDLELTRFAGLRFEQTHAGKGVFPGFTGAAEVFCHSDNLEVHRALGILQAYAFFAGVGAKTAYGLGLATPY